MTAHAIVAVDISFYFVVVIILDRLTALATDRKVIDPFLIMAVSVSLRIIRPDHDSRSSL